MSVERFEKILEAIEKDGMAEREETFKQLVFELYGVPELEKFKLLEKLFGLGFDIGYGCGVNTGTSQ